MRQREIRAKFDEYTITVYQAYNDAIADSAIRYQTFEPPHFKIERMTWIKPSFLWMMYRSGWASKKGQERVLSIRMKREGFEWTLMNSCLTTFDRACFQSIDEWKKRLSTSRVRIQWDPERDIFLRPLPYRSLQIGLGVDAVKQYISNWIISIEDVTDSCKNLRQLIEKGKATEAESLLPKESVYQIDPCIAVRIHAG